MLNLNYSGYSAVSVTGRSGYFLGFSDLDLRKSQSSFDNLKESVASDSTKKHFALL
jgi:hypothetical protein